MIDTAIGGLTVDAEAGKLLFMVRGSDEDFKGRASFSLIWVEASIVAQREQGYDETH